MADLYSGKELAKYVKSQVHVDTQARENSFDLTVSQVYYAYGKSCLDFGGSEYSAGEQKPVNPVKEEGQEYGWWDLGEGNYLISLNESFDSLPALGFLSPHPHLLKAGCTHPTLTVLEWKNSYVIPLHIEGNGLSIKENAKVTKLVVEKR